MRTVGEII